MTENNQLLYDNLPDFDGGGIRLYDNQLIKDHTSFDNLNNTVVDNIIHVI